MCSRKGGPGLWTGNRSIKRVGQRSKTELVGQRTNVEQKGQRTKMSQRDRIPRYS